MQGGDDPPRVPAMAPVMRPAIARLAHLASPVIRLPRRLPIRRGRWRRRRLDRRRTCAVARRRGSRDRLGIARGIDRLRCFDRLRLCRRRRVARSIGRRRRRRCRDGSRRCRDVGFGPQRAGLLRIADRGFARGGRKAAGVGGLRACGGQDNRCNARRCNQNKFVHVKSPLVHWTGFTWPVSLGRLARPGH